MGISIDLTIVLVQMGGEIHSARVPTHGPSPASAVVGDLDGDDDLELLLWDLEQLTFGLYQADFLGNFVFEQSMELTQLCPDCNVPTGPFAPKLAVGNLDGDAIGDLALAFGDQLHFGLGPLTSSAVWSSWQDSPSPLTQLLVVDLNDDGDDDVVLASSVEQLTYILANSH